jgi:acetylornithine/N-succinyldiaminopimelate aminotransferase
MDAVIAPNFLSGVEARGHYLTQNLIKLSGRHQLGEVRGRGLMVALDLVEPIATKLIDQAQKAGLLLNAPRPNLLRFLPALTVSLEEIDTMLTILEDILKSIIN